MNTCETGCSLISEDNSTKLLVQQIKREVKKISEDTTAKLLLQDGKIRETCLYIKENLSNYLRTLFDTMEYNGELADIIREILLGIDGSQSWMNVKSLGASGDGVTDDTEAIQEAVYKYRRIYIPSGTYKLTKPLYLPCHTSILCSDNATMKSYHNKPFVINGKPSDSDISGYDGHGNITIDGGIWDNNIEYSRELKGGFAFAHAQNITLRNMTILHTVKTHSMEIAGVDGCVIENVKFIGCVPHDSVPYVEAIQLEMCTDGFGYFGKPDYTPTKNVVVRNCVFDKDEDTSYFGTACGNHATINDVFIENVTFQDNLVIGCTYAGFRAYCFRNVGVYHNKFISCERGVMMSGSTGTDSFSNNIYGQQTGIPQSCEYVWIDGNTFTECRTVDIWSNNYSTDKATSFVRRVHITNNTSVGCKAVSVYIVRGYDLMISGNIIEKPVGSAFDFNYVNDVKLSDNSILESGNYGIMLRDGNVDNSVTGNIHISMNLIKGCANTGMNLRNITGLVISGNEIVDGGGHPILINNLCSGVSIMGNVMKHSTAQGVGCIKVVGDLNSQFDIVGNTPIGYNAPDLTEVGDTSTIRIYTA